MGYVQEGKDISTVQIFLYFLDLEFLQEFNASDHGLSSQRQ